MIVSDPNRPLDRGIEMSKIDYYCQKIAPYVLMVAIGLLVAFILIALVKYGWQWTGTESNIVYNHMGDI